MTAEHHYKGKIVSIDISTKPPGWWSVNILIEDPPPIVFDTFLGEFEQKLYPTKQNAIDHAKAEARWQLHKAEP